jgi:putative spermidine/putrescine transport system substrate-binding protein
MTSTRRHIIKSAGVLGIGLAAPAVWTSARAATSLTCTDSGGLYTTAFTEAFYKPFTRETGIEVVSVSRPANPAAVVKAQVETGAYQWDVSGSVTPDIANLLETAGLLDPLDTTGPNMSAIPASMKTPTFVASGLTAFVMAYRHDQIKTKPASFADFWNPEKFPGRRALRKIARDTLESALRSMGRSPSPEVYSALARPGGLDEVFKQLDLIKPQVKVWWTAAPQAAQLLESGEVDICPTYNGRAQAAIEAGAPVTISWDQGFYTLEGWIIPKGSPKADLARQLVQFASRPDRQAAYTKILASGPTHPGAFEFVDKTRAETLPSAPQNLSKLSRIDEVFWSQHSEINERFNAWLLAP